MLWRKREKLDYFCTPSLVKNLNAAPSLFFAISMSRSPSFQDLRRVGDTNGSAPARERWEIYQSSCGLKAGGFGRMRVYDCMTALFRLIFFIHRAFSTRFKTIIFMEAQTGPNRSGSSPRLICGMSVKPGSCVMHLECVNGA